MNWDDLLTEFRALGGVADNVTMGQGSLGRGVFPIDPKKPVRLRTPPNLLVPTADTELRADRLVVKPSASLGEGERKFFERYQQHFSWGAGVFDELWQAQLQWSELPQNLQDKLNEIGPVDAGRFAAPSADQCHHRYLKTRSFSYRGTPVVMPVMELVNHSDDASFFDSSNGIGVEYTSNDEVRVNYGSHDCWTMAMTYGFCAAQRRAHSLRTLLTFEGLDIQISRKFERNERINRVTVPVVTVDGNKVDFSFLLLGNIQRPRLPRSIFLHVAKTTPIQKPDELFDLIQHHNCVKLTGFLRVADGLSMPLATTLRRAAYRQLETLSAHFGSHPLEDNS